MTVKCRNTNPCADGDSGERGIEIYVYAALQSLIASFLYVRSFRLFIKIILDVMTSQRVYIDSQHIRFVGIIPERVVLYLGVWCQFPSKQLILYLGVSLQPC